ncbi:hypothetical protein [uncultured Arthrobacter sp.]|uniref:hypothetical protein n=1 Tax=uncultured Arthrobacter sp. TaxID=114050 RepID=UPI00261A2D1F|nr:hypothetical protein [uncultured Arthrobacter sp.]
MMLSYTLWIQFRGQRMGLVWQTEVGTGEVEGDTDSVLVQDGRIISVGSATEFAAVAQQFDLELEEGTEELQNLDELERLLELPVSDDICDKLLNAWNLFGDIARSVGASLEDSGPKTSKCCDKLFYGTNLESITPAGEHYSPDFTDEERLLIAEVFNRGRTILAAYVEKSEPPVKDDRRE